MANFTSDQLATLEKAIAEGVLRVRYSDKEVYYRNLSEMLQTRDLMRKDLGLSRGARGRTYISHKRD